MDYLTKIAFNHLHPVVKRKDDYKLFYGDNKSAWYGPDSYGNCASAKKKLLQSGQGYKREFFKIK